MAVKFLIPFSVHTVNKMQHVIVFLLSRHSVSIVSVLLSSSLPKFMPIIPLDIN